MPLLRTRPRPHDGHVLPVRLTNTISPWENAPALPILRAAAIAAVADLPTCKLKDSEISRCAHRTLAKLDFALVASAIGDLATRVLFGVNGGTEVPAVERRVFQAITIVAGDYPHRLVDGSSWRN